MQSLRLGGSLVLILTAVAFVLVAGAAPAAAAGGSHGHHAPGDDGRLVVCPAHDDGGHESGHHGGGHHSETGRDGPECEFTDIQAAVDAADPGDTVYLTAGEYHPGGVVTVSNTSDLTIAGAGRDATILYGSKHQESHDDHSHGSGTESAGTAQPMYHDGEAHNPFTDPQGYAEYVLNYPVEFAMDHANNPVARGTTHAEQAQSFAGNQTGSDGNESHHTPSYDAIFVTADNVTVRDLHIEDYNGNGVYYDGVRGFRVARVDAVDNGAYGIYAIRSTMGTFEDSYASGHFDSGYYLGEVVRCDCVIRNVTAEGNLLGYSGTGAGWITIENSTWKDNAAGIVPNVLPNEPSPQIHIEVRNNRIVDNNNQTAFEEFHFAGSLHAPVGSGVVVGGGSYNTVEDNLIRNHSRAGVVITYMVTQPSGNAVIDNRFEDNDLEVWWDGGGANNCFSGNSYDDGNLTYDAGTYWNAQDDLPECNTDNTAMAPDPQQLSEIGTVVVFGCEQEAAPDGENCHAEEPQPHFHPPQTPAPANAMFEQLFGADIGDGVGSDIGSEADGATTTDATVTDGDGLV